jgi:methionyl-tRNA formyltransferase
VRIVLVGEETAGVQALRLVAERGHEVVAAMGSTIAGTAEGMGVPVWEAEEVREPALAARIRAAGADILLNVHALFVIHPDVLAAPRVGAFNLHPGPLPRFAGLNAPSWAIYLGEQTHGVTLHWMGAEIDAGDIAYERSFEIEPSDTGLTLTAKCVRHGLPLIAELLEMADSGHVPRTPQPGEGRRYFGREIPHGGRLPWSMPARRVVDLVRASDYGPWPSPWGRPTATLEGREVQVLRGSATGETSLEPPGTVGEKRGRSRLVAAEDEWVAVERIRVDGETGDASEALSFGRIFDVEPVQPLPM